MAMDLAPAQSPQPVQVVPVHRIGGRRAGALPALAPSAPTPRPRFVQIEPVGQCNLRCRMCAIPFRKESARGHPPACIDFDLFTRLLDGFPECQELQLQGLGEPLLHPRFFDMVEHAARRGIRVSTNTNLTLLTQARAERCVTSGLATMHVSIDGATAATYEHIRPGARFAKVLRNLDRVVAARARLAAGTPALRWIMVLMRANLHELPDVVRLAAEHGIDDLHAQHLCHDFREQHLPARYAPMRAFVERETLAHEDPARVADHFARAREAAASLGVSLRLPEVAATALPSAAPVVPGEGRRRCAWPWTGAYFSWDGELMPCCMVSTPDRASFGSVAARGVAATWNSPEAEHFRERLAAGDPPPEVCQGCAVWSGTF